MVQFNPSALHMGSVTAIVIGVVEEGEVPLSPNTIETAKEDPEPNPRSAGNVHMRLMRARIVSEWRHDWMAQRYSPFENTAKPMLKHDKFMARSRSQIEVAVCGFFRSISEEEKAKKSLISQWNISHTITAPIDEILTFGYYHDVYSGYVARSILLLIAQFLQYNQQPTGFYRISSAFPRDFITLCVDNIYDTEALIRDKNDIDDVDLLNWIGVIRDLKGTPYEGGSFYVQIQFPQMYPFQPPGNKFITKVYSLNVNKRGQHCLNIDKDEWSPNMKLMTLMRCLTSLLTDVFDTYNVSRPDLGDLYEKDKETYEKNAREETKKYAM